jgi:glycosyltransferase involved in cell wall biosynthesis
MLIITELYYPEDTSTGYFLTGIAEGLATAGVPVRVLCAQPSYRLKGVGAPEREVRAGVEIRRVRAPAGDKNKLWQRAWLAIGLTWRFAMATREELREGEVVLVVTNPPTLPWIVAWVAHSRKAKAHLLVHDVYPDVLVPTGLAKEGSMVFRVVDALQRWAWPRFDAVVVLGRDMRARVLRKCPQLDGRVHIIPNWGDLSAVPCLPRAGNALRARLGLADAFVVQFSGNLGRTHGVDDFLALAAKLRDEPMVRFLVYGWGAGRARIEEAVASGELPNLTLLPPCERSELAEYLNACDLFFLPFKAGMEGISVPSRLYNVLAAGNPVLAVAGAESELAMVIEEEKIGWVVAPGNIEGMLAAVLSAMDDKRSLPAMRGRARAAAETKYSKDRVVADFVRLVAPEATRSSGINPPL